MSIVYPLVAMGCLFQNLVLSAARQDFIAAWDVATNRLSWIFGLGFSLTASLIACTLIAWLNPALDRFKRISVCVFLGLVARDGLDPTNYQVVAYAAQNLVFDAAGAAALGAVIVGLPHVCARATQTSVKARGYRYAHKEAAVLVFAVGLLLLVYVGLFVYPLPRELSVSMPVTSLRLNSRPMPSPPSVTRQLPSLTLTASNGSFTAETNSPGNTHNRALLRLGGKSDVSLGTIDLNVPSGSSMQDLFNAPLDGQTDLAGVSGLILETMEGRADAPVPPKAVAWHFNFKPTLPNTYWLTVQDALPLGPLMMSFLMGGFVSIESPGSTGRLNTSFYGSGMATLSAPAGGGPWAIKSWVQKATAEPAGVTSGALNESTLIEQIARWMGPVPVPPPRIVYQQDGIYHVEADTGADYVADATKAMTFPILFAVRFSTTTASIRSDGLTCTPGCTVFGGELWADYVQIDVKSDASLRFDLVKFDMGPGDILTVSSYEPERVAFSDGNRTTLHWNNARVRLGTHPLNSTLWSKIPSEWLTGLVGALLTAAGLRRKHIVDFFGRLMHDPTDG